MVYLDLQRHLREQHPALTVREHQRLRRPTDDEVTDAYRQADYMRYRSAEKCQVEDCNKKGVPLRDLTRHLRTVHGMSRSFYNRYINCT